ncbi:MAG: DUF1893 domain-containing protein [Bacteroides sp.]|nr:DUF1893 domain-containing protein [Bacillota bacterium]MCM1393565.1 DUF1893 domain-containing protein [[Eubacterium] siraeum]MCM1455016.1 DUF1893 domain-containing protein [Bacteroides sp.]
MTDLTTAKNNLAGHTICLCKDGSCLFSSKRGIAPMMDFISDGVDLAGYSVADIVVGKAAAFLFVKCGIKSVFAKTLSKSGKRILEEYGIEYEYEILADKIINRAGTDICPMEKAVLNCDNADEAYKILKYQYSHIS